MFGTTLKAYDENGELVMRQGPFTIISEAIAMFEQEKKEAIHNKVFALELAVEGTKPEHRNANNYMSYAR